MTEVPVRALSTEGSPRAGGTDPEHVRTLAAAGVLPPIIVHRPTMRVVDGLHRLEAARLRGQESIDARYVEGDEADAFVLAVRANTGHGLPLSPADRRNAAARILRTHPRWSTRMVAAAAGVPLGTAAEIRRRTLGEPGEEETRIGRDGRLRPLDGARGRRAATELIVEHPELSLRQIARVAGVSPETVRNLRNRIRGRAGNAGSAGRPAEPRALPPGARRRTAAEPPPRDGAAMVERLKADPALRFSEAGRDLLRLLLIHTISPAEWDRLAGIIPASRRAEVARLARACARIWAEFAQQAGRDGAGPRGKAG